MLLAALLRSGVGRSEELAALLRRIIFREAEPGVELVSAYMLIGMYDALIVVRADEEEVARRFISKVEGVLGARAVLHVASPIKP